MIDESGDRKAGTKTAHVGRQYLGNIGKIDNGVVSVSSLWADESVYYPLHVQPYTPAHYFGRGKADPKFRTKPQIALELVQQAVAMQLPFRAVVADCFYGEHEEFKQGLHELQVGYVLALKPSHAWWHRVDELGSLWEVANASTWDEPTQPGDWQAVQRVFRDGHTETWWALEVLAGPYGSHKSRRAVVVTTDPAKLPELSTWYLVTNLPAPRVEPVQAGALAVADVVEVVRLYGLRMWVEQSYKQLKHTLGWAQYQVRSDVAIRRHWVLVYCGFSFCWWHYSHTWAHEGVVETAHLESAVEHPIPTAVAEWGESNVKQARQPQLTWPIALRAVRAWLEPWVMVWRYWRAWSKLPPPPELQALLTWVKAGHGICLHNTS